MKPIVTIAAFAAAATASLRPESELTHSCFGFPDMTFHRKNSVKDTHGASPFTAGGLEVGELVFDFTLSDLDGNSHTLSNLIAKKPVILLWGMYTCPAYQGLGTSAPFDKCSYQVFALLHFTNPLQTDSLFVNSFPPARVGSSRVL